LTCNPVLIRAQSESNQSPIRVQSVAIRF
jgi:hypothetical protein